MDKVNIKTFEYIPANPDRNMILTRLGYRKTSTLLTPDYRKKLEDIINKGLMLCNTRGVYARFRITDRTQNHVVLNNDVVLESASLSKLLQKSGEVVLMASTVGFEIITRIQKEVESGDASLGVILDSLASETADSALDWMVDFINKLLRKEALRLTKNRYSPGYGDLLLENQKIIYDLLELQKLGIEITESLMLLPEKSVIAIAGIEEIIDE